MKRVDIDPFVGDVAVQLPLARLKKLGATHEDLTALRREFNSMTRDQQEQAVQDIDSWDDDEIKDAIFNGREDSSVDSSEDTGDVFAEVPNGTAREILAWVDGDEDKANAAHAKERTKGSDARTTLLRELEKITGVLAN